MAKVLLAMSVTAALLVGCGSDPHPAVAAAQRTLAGLGRLALVYVTQPLCVGTNVAGCADPVIKAQIKTAYDSAADVLVASQADADAGKPVNLIVLNGALASLQTLVAKTSQGAK